MPRDQEGKPKVAQRQIGGAQEEGDEQRRDRGDNRAKSGYDFQEASQQGHQSRVGQAHEGHGDPHHQADGQAQHHLPPEEGLPHLVDFFTQAAKLFRIARWRQAIQKAAQLLGIFDQVEGDDKNRYDPEHAGDDVEEQANRLGGKGPEEILERPLHIADQVLQAQHVSHKNRRAGTGNRPDRRSIAEGPGSDG